MKAFLSKLKIPTLLGLAIIIAGIIVGVFLVLREQVFTSRASPDATPKNITLSNLTDAEATISFETSAPVFSFITFGQTNPDEHTALDTRDSNPREGASKLHSIHYFTLKNLLPKTVYQYKVITGKKSSDILKFTTAAPLSQQSGFKPIIGSVLYKDAPLSEGIAYLSIADATMQSALIKSSGNFLIPISQIRKSDLSDGFLVTDEIVAKLTIVSNDGQSNVLFKLTAFDKGLPPVKLGADLDLTNIIPSPQPSLLIQDLSIYDLNNDGKINSADNAILLQNSGKNFKNKKADLNEDGVVDKKDSDLMAKQINQ